jgi:hypothetical protein
MVFVRIFQLLFTVYAIFECFYDTKPEHDIKSEHDTNSDPRYKAEHILYPGHMFLLFLSAFLNMAIALYSHIHFD